MKLRNHAETNQTDLGKLGGIDLPHHSGAGRMRPRMEKEMTGNGGRGTQKGADAGEAGGRGAQTVYVCINCGAQNYVDPNWSWFSCWKCNLQKPLPLPGH